MSDVPVPSILTAMARRLAPAGTPVVPGMQALRVGRLLIRIKPNSEDRTQVNVDRVEGGL